MVVVVALLMRGLGRREPIIVAVAVPVVFGVARAVNLIAGYIVNCVT